MWGAGKGLRGGLMEAGGGGAGWREQLGLQGKPGQGGRRVGTREAAGASAATRPRRRPQRGGRGRTVSGVEAAVWWGRAVDCLGRAALAGILGQWPAEACPSGSSVPECVPKDWPPLPWALVHRGRHSRWPRGRPDRAVHPDRGLPCGFFLCRVWGLRQGRAQASPSQDPGLVFGG